MRVACTKVRSNRSSEVLEKSDRKRQRQERLRTTSRVEYQSRIVALLLPRLFATPLTLQRLALIVHLALAECVLKRTSHMLETLPDPPLLLRDRLGEAVNALHAVLEEFAVLGALHVRRSGRGGSRGVKEDRLLLSVADCEVDEEVVLQANNPRLLEGALVRQSRLRSTASRGYVRERCVRRRTRQKRMKDIEHAPTAVVRRRERGGGVGVQAEAVRLQEGTNNEPYFAKGSLTHAARILVEPAARKLGEVPLPR